jgi:Holliday junction resolvasome RuvABC endonuclease subunit
MSLKNIVGSNNWGKLVAIDPASHSLAWAVIDNEKNVIATGKIDLKKEKTESEKFAKIAEGIEKVIKEHNPDVAAIEQSVYVQNFQSSRIISYIIGFTWGILHQSGIKTRDINPLKWKPAIGYKNLSKQDRVVLESNGVKGSVNIKMKNERKTRVRDIVSIAYGDDTPGLDDDDIIDALGIALWYYKTGGKDGIGTVQG